MYAIYSTVQTTHRGEYQFKRQTNFFGNHKGLIPKLLGERLAVGQMEPYSWRLPIAEILGTDGEAFIIDLKPNNKNSESSLSLYELLDVWGHSELCWTPAMLRLRGLVVDGEPRIHNPKAFAVEYSDEHRNIYSFLYFDGGIRNGKITGKWTAPRASPTNSALLWPMALRYFVEQAGYRRA